MKTKNLLSGLLAAAMLLPACGEVEVQDNLLLDLNGTTWYEEKYEEDKGSGFKLAESTFWWIHFSDGQVEDWENEKTNYTFNVAERKITIWGKTYAFKQITPNKMEWTREEGGARYRRTYARVQPVDTKLLAGKWLWTKCNNWDKNKQEWIDFSPIWTEVITFTDKSKGSHKKDDSPATDFKCEVAGNVIHDKGNFPYGDKALITGLTADRMTIIWRDTYGQHQDTFTKQK